MRHYLPIIRDSPVYPVIKDSRGIVLSLPPIINGDHSKITLATRNIFIELTATDLTKAKVVLDTLICMFSRYCAEPFTAELCQVVTADGETCVYPQLEYRTESVTVDKVNNLVGIQESADKVADLLSRMCLKATAIKDEIQVS